MDNIFKDAVIGDMYFTDDKSNPVAFYLGQEGKNDYHCAIPNYSDITNTISYIVIRCDSTGLSSTDIDIVEKANTKSDPIKFESCGAHLRNLLGPYQNFVCIIENWLSGELDDNIVKKMMTKFNLQEGVDRIIEFSKSDKLEDLNWR